MEFGVWSLEFGIWSLEFGVWNLEFGVWNLEFGVWSLELTSTIKNYSIDSLTNQLINSSCQVQGTSY